MIVFALTLVASANTFQLFQEFTVEYGKKYESLQDFAFRLEKFEENLIRIDTLNALHRAAGGEDVFGINVFADMSPEEFSVRLMKNLTYRAPAEEPSELFEITGPATIVDWRTKGAVTAVKDQGQCGSCWAFSADEAMESFEFIQQGGPIQQLSQMQCASCTYTYNGCNGGWPHDAYINAIENRNGIETNSAYPYNINGCGTCKFGATGKATNPVSDDNGYKSPAKGQLQNQLNTNGPLSVCVAAESWQTYKSGVLKTCPGQVDHCVQAVGYNSGASEPYWIVRNSWGTGWGVQGYIYLDMTTNNGNICDIQNYMTYPTTTY